MDSQAETPSPRDPPKSDPQHDDGCKNDYSKPQKVGNPIASILKSNA